jgi:hypothetical protein
MLNQNINVEQYLQNVAQQNPQVRMLLNQKQQNNMSYQDLVVQLARQNNINLTPYVQALSKQGIKM